MKRAIIARAIRSPGVIDYWQQSGRYYRGWYSESKKRFFYQSRDENGRFRKLPKGPLD